MISFRFHLVSIVAVFLALGLGVLTGTTVLNRGIVTQLENRTDQLASQADELRREVDQLRQQVGEEVGLLEGFGEAVVRPLTGAHLAGVQAVVVTQEATDEQTIGQVLDALDVAGAEIALELKVESRMALTTEEDRQALEEIIDSVGTADPSVEAAHDMAAQLSFNQAGSDVITELVEAGFLSRDVPEGPGDQPPDDPLIVVVAGASQAPLIEPSSFLVPLTEQLVANGQAVVAAEMQRSVYPFVTTLRGREAAEGMVTVDDADRIPGAVALILAAEALLDSGTAGHYGVKDGAVSVLPPIVPVE